MIIKLLLLLSLSPQTCLLKNSECQFEIHASLNITTILLTNTKRTQDNKITTPVISNQGLAITAGNHTEVSVPDNFQSQEVNESF